jgi:hypothetical protein
MFAACIFFWSNVGPTARVSELMEQAQQEIRYRPNVYQGIMEFTNSEYTNKFYSLFIGGLLSTALLCCNWCC